MKKIIKISILGILIAGFIFLQILSISVLKSNLVIELGLDFEVIDSMKIECYIDDKLVLDTITYDYEILVPLYTFINNKDYLLPLVFRKKNHSLFFIVNGNKSPIARFNSCFFTMVCVKYTEEKRDFLYPGDDKNYIYIRVQKHPFRFIM